MRKVMFLLFGLSLFFLSSCLTIYEKYTLNRDGSGTMEYLIDLSDMRSALASVSDSTIDGQADMDFEKSFVELLPSLNKFNGISNVRITGNPGEYTYGIKYNFSNQEALNHAIGLILKDSTDSKDQFVVIKRRRFVRNPGTSDKLPAESVFSASDSSDTSLVHQILDEMNYRVSVTFPAKIKRVKTEAEVEMVNDSSVTVTANFNQIIQNGEILKTKIITK